MAGGLPGCASLRLQPPPPPLATLKVYPRLQSSPWAPRLFSCTGHPSRPRLRPAFLRSKPRPSGLRLRGRGGRRKCLAPSPPKSLHLQQGAARLRLVSKLRRTVGQAVGGFAADRLAAWVGPKVREYRSSLTRSAPSTARPQHEGLPRTHAAAPAIWRNARAAAAVVAGASRSPYEPPSSQRGVAVRPPAARPAPYGVERRTSETLAAPMMFSGGSRVPCGRDAWPSNVPHRTDGRLAAKIPPSDR